MRENKDEIGWELEKGNETINVMIEKDVIVTNKRNEEDEWDGIERGYNCGAKNGRESRRARFSFVMWFTFCDFYCECRRES